MPSHPVVFWELATQNQEKSVEFFRKVFDWEIELDERLGFYIVKTGPVPEDMEGAIFTLKKSEMAILNYLYSSGGY